MTDTAINPPDLPAAEPEPLPAWFEPRRLPDGRIDLVIEHPRLGRIPYTASLDDVADLGRRLHATILAAEAAGEVTVPDAPPPPEIVPELSPRQFEWLLVETGLDAVWQAAIAHARSQGKRKLHAFLRAQLKAQAFQRQQTLDIKNHPLIRQVIAQVAPGEDLSDARIVAAWDAAAQQTFETVPDET